MTGENLDNFKFFVIGAGLPRTGTLSLKVALEKILPGNCMHFATILRTNLKEVLDDVFDESSTERTFKNYFKKHNIVAGADVLFIFHYKRAMEAFPEAKVILTTREPPKWVSSMEQTVYKNWYNNVYQSFPYSIYMLLYPSFKRYFEYMRRNSMFDNSLESIHTGNGETFYLDWIDNVKKSVAPERLLIFNVKEGWEPLCKFLDLPIPDEPFPHVNDTLTFQKRTQTKILKMWLLFLSPIALTIALGYAVYKYYD